MASRSSGGVKKPVLPSTTISLGPPASRATTGSPQAIASSTTSPNVSVTEQCTNRSALAYARARFSPSKNPVNSTLSPTGANADRTSSSTLGFLFPPTINILNANPRSTNALATRAKNGNPFSGANRPTQQSTISPFGDNSLLLHPISLLAGANNSVSTPLPKCINFHFSTPA